MAASHSLSPYIFSLDDRCKQMDEREWVLVKEKVDPKAMYVRHYRYCMNSTVNMYFASVPD